MRRHPSDWCYESKIRSAIRLFGLKLSDFMEGPHRLSWFFSEKGDGVDLLHVLIDDLGLTAVHVREQDNSFLRQAVRNQRADVLVVLAERLGMTAEDARASENEALVLAASRGMYTVLEILLNTFGLTGHDVRARGSEALTSTAEFGYTASLYLLIDKFGLPKMRKLMLDKPVVVPSGGVYRFRDCFNDTCFCQRLLSMFNEEFQRASSLLS